MPLDSLCFDPNAIEEDALGSLYRYWSAKARDGRLPARADIDPAELRDLLPHLVLVDTADSLGAFRYRLFGTEVCGGFGQDRTNLTFSALGTVENADQVNHGYWQAYQSAAPSYFNGRTVSSQRDWLLYSRLLLPLSSDNRHVDMILGGFVFYSKLPNSSWPGRKRS